MHFVAAADAASQFLLSLTSLVLKHFDLSSRFKVEAFLFLFAPAAFPSAVAQNGIVCTFFNATRPIIPWLKEDLEVLFHSLFLCSLRGF